MSVALQPSVSGAPPGMQLVKSCHFSINNTNQVPLGPMLHPQCQVLPLLATLLINLPMQLVATNLAVREHNLMTMCFIFMHRSIWAQWTSCRTTDNQWAWRV